MISRMVADNPASGTHGLQISGRTISSHSNMIRCHVVGCLQSQGLHVREGVIVVRHISIIKRDDERSRWGGHAKKGFNAVSYAPPFFSHTTKLSNVAPVLEV